MAGSFGRRQGAAPACGQDRGPAGRGQGADRRGGSAGRGSATACAVLRLSRGADKAFRAGRL
ncbi:hypothetical protein GLE_3616 [Lysobacter enzymogenes]|uniref:Uncharacterized protein n=1 Tax=Lysobacter enzymogenes TaxID=69 RepID=A0A0S2DK96_LYSEN|nr:hypothetical protein GLE_3616 [Lysobacter enzymogenes]